MISLNNLINDLPPQGTEEHVAALLVRPGIRLERIVSWGQITPADEWYDQEQEEWVMVIAGAARLRIEGQTTHEMRPGDWVLLPAHCRHRVEWTDPDQPTVWLALHYWS